MNDEVRVQDVVVITDSRCTLHIDCFDYNITYCMLIHHACWLLQLCFVLLDLVRGLGKKVSFALAASCFALQSRSR
jgi:hypothetical protein